MKNFTDNDLTAIDLSANDFTANDLTANEVTPNKDTERLRLCICGACGKTGSRVIALSKANDAFKLVCAVDEKTPTSRDQEFSYISDIRDAACKIDVLIDFSSVRGLNERLEYAVQKGIAVVLAVTGLTKNERDIVREVSQKIPVFYASNFSIAANALRLLSAKARSLLDTEFSVDVLEKHHASKKDAPSGTALCIAEEIKKVSRERDEAESKALPPLKERIFSVRAGTLVGEHEVLFCGDGETLSLTHRAYDRDVFARGALKAALFLRDKPPRLYGMDDLLR